MKSLWNWIELCTICLVIASVVELWLYENNPVDGGLRNLLTTTGLFIFLSFVSYLKKTFNPFATFVGGVTQVSDEWIFLCCLFVFFAFTHYWILLLNTLRYS